MKEYDDAISVIVNIYNEEAYLRKCIDSLLAQTCLPMEIILVDDGSQDSSPDICREYAERYPSIIHCILKGNEGLVKARKTGLNIAKGDCVAFIDGDDWIDSGWFETLYRAMVENGVDIAAAGYKEDLPGSYAPKRNLIPEGIYEGDRLKNQIYAVMLNAGEYFSSGIFSYLWNKLFRKNVIYDCLMRIDERIFIGEDACAVYPAILKSHRVQVLDYCGYHYRQRVDSMVKTNYSRELECERLQILAKYLQTSFQASEFWDVLRPQLENFLLSQILVRTDGIMNKQEEQPSLFPFKNVSKGCKIILYGAGTFGQQLYRRIADTKYCEVVGWVDPRAQQYRKLGLDVRDIADINLFAYDRIVMALDDEITREQQVALLSEIIKCDRVFSFPVLSALQRSEILTRIFM